MAQIFHLASVLRFTFQHPHFRTHGLSRRKISVVPVLIGTPFPRSDLPSHEEKYALVVLALFKPWDRCASSPLKGPKVDWNEALQVVVEQLPPAHKSILAHSQEQWQCKMAADLFSDRRHALKVKDGLFTPSDRAEALVIDPRFRLDQQEPEDEEGSLTDRDALDFDETMGSKLRSTLETLFEITTDIGCYGDAPTSSQLPHINVVLAGSDSAKERQVYDDWSARIKIIRGAGLYTMALSSHTNVHSDKIWEGQAYRR